MINKIKNVKYTKNYLIQKYIKELWKKNNNQCKFVLC